MHVWMSNSRTCQAYERAFFAIICNNLTHRCGAQRVAERFESLATLAALPWLDQPRVIDPTALVFEIHEAWDQLWALRAHELVISPVVGDPGRRINQDSRETERVGREVLGRYLAAPLHGLAAFAASAFPDAVLRVGTHRELVVGPEHLQSWRIIQGGLSSADRTLAAEIERNSQPGS
jgi:hypothetical protein